jgi:hypothetical protein
MTETSEEILISALQEKCTKQPVQTAMLRQKCLSNLIQKDRFIAGIVFLTTGRPEKTADTNLPSFSSRVSLREHEVRFASLKRTYTFNFSNILIKICFFLNPELL